MSQITTHVLDTAVGGAATGVPVRLEEVDGAGWALLATGVTDTDGRVSDLGPDSVPPGRYRLVFDTAAYSAASARSGFFAEVALVVEVTDARHYHVPLLLAPFGISSYRGT
jgi:5-hydroxyisourate hydrolase